MRCRTGLESAKLCGSLLHRRCLELQLGDGLGIEVWWKWLQRVCGRVEEKKRWGAVRRGTGVRHHLQRLLRRACYWGLVSIPGGDACTDACCSVQHGRCGARRRIGGSGGRVAADSAHVPCRTLGCGARIGEP